MESLVDLYRSHTGKSPSICKIIAGGGSRRQYYRLTDEQGKSIIGAKGTSKEENETFIYLAEHFAKHALPVPHILSVSADGLSYLQSDLGTISLYDALKSGRESADGYSPEDVVLLERVIRMLPQIQVKGSVGLNFTKCYPQEVMDEQCVMFDLNYFKYCFLKTTSLEFNEMELETCFREMAHNLGASVPPYFLYRDFQARNVMLDNEGNPFFIDFQGGRRGPLQYDLVSFLWQASSHFGTELRQHLINEYIDSLKQYTQIDEEAFRASIPQWVLFRTLQVLGAYGLRGRFERKKYFLDSIPAAIKNLKELLADKNACPYHYLYKVLSALVELPEFNVNPTSNNTLPSVSRYDNKGSLKVRVYSFSYKKGIPEDNSGNGGGYVFDCRSTHNPGRYEPYKQLTGLDQPVIDFLEQDGEICTFLSHIYELADAHVQRYIERGFTSLMFSFGCTGGQHRSVYSAQHLAQHIHEKFGVEVQVVHREQGIETLMPTRRKAMVFAAGLGSRLKPLTDTMPKALVPVNSKPLIEHVCDRLISFGFNDIVVNVHHFAEMIETWATSAMRDKYQDRGIRISISDERAQLLDTGGGLAHARELLTASNSSNRVLIHNVDILSNADLDQLWNYSLQADAVLLVSARKTSRYLVFDNDMKLVGWANIQTREIRSPYPEVHEALSNVTFESLDIAGKYYLRAFAGIHCISTSLLKQMDGYPDKFSIIDFYLNVCGTVNIKGYEQEGLQITDVGKMDTLATAQTL